MKIDKLQPPSNWEVNSKIHLDFGCGHGAYRNPFASELIYGADILPQENRKNYLRINTDNTLPVRENYFDSISAFDVIEHLSREGHPNEFIFFMNEAHRVLKPNGILFCVTPAYPNPTAFQDPTHKNIITENTVYYFTGNSAPAKTMGYGFEGSFHLLAQFWSSPRIDIRNSNWANKKKIIPLIVSASRSLSTARSTLSQFLNPSHLVWVLEKN
ncbi:MAG: hypothetical protein RIQ45_140 [Actinomycetota bacterium]|jgi:SAM-dependent methyltransferase